MAERGAIPRLPVREGALALIVAALLAAIARANPSVSIAGLAGDIADDTALLLILALGQALVLLTRAVDLSVAANAALSGMLAALLNKAHPEWGVAAPLLCAVICGAMLGAANGLIVWRLAVPPIVATLGTMSVFRGLTFFASGGAWVNSGDMSSAFLSFQHIQMLRVSLATYCAAAAFAALAFLLHFTRLGRTFRIAGANPIAALYIGVRPERAQFQAYVICGALAGFVGALWVSRYGVAYTDVAAGFELQVIAACLVGGVAISGGSGSAAGVLLGALFLGVLRNALPLVGVSPFWQMAASGAVIVLACVLNAIGARPPRKRILEQGA